jgi:hypothetical protein
MPLPRDGNAEAIPVVHPDSTETVSIGAGSLSSGTISSKVIRLVATSDCHVAFGLSPTATGSSMFLPGGVVEYFAVADNEKVAVIQNASAGTLFVTQVS